MRSAHNPRHKLEAREIRRMRVLFESRGWKIKWLALYFGVHRRSVLHHARFLGWVRRVTVADRMPEAVARLYRQRKRERYKERKGDTYEYLRMVKEFKPPQHCGHQHWIMRCSHCGTILGSETTHASFARNAPQSDRNAGV